MHRLVSPSIPIRVRADDAPAPPTDCVWRGLMRLPAGRQVRGHRSRQLARRRSPGVSLARLHVRSDPAKESFPRDQRGRLATRDRLTQKAYAGRRHSHLWAWIYPPVPQTRSASPQRGLEPGARHMRFGEGDPDRLQLAAVAAELAGPGLLGQAVEDMFGEEFGRGVASPELGHVVQIAIVQRGHYRLQRGVGSADINNDSVAVERLGNEGRVDNESRAVQRLCRSEDGTLKGMSDHDMVANFDGEQGDSSGVSDGLAKHAI